MKENIVGLLLDLNAKLERPVLDRTKSEINAYAEKLVSKARILSIMNKGRLEAFIAFYDNDPKGKTAYLSMLAVAYEALGKAQGKLLMQAAIDVIGQQGFHFFDIVGDIPSKRAIDFALGFGFKEVVIEGETLYRKEL